MSNDKILNIMNKLRLSRQQSREQTRQRLLDAAHSLFVEKGFGATSVEHITSTAGYSRGAFYSNFDDKGSIFLALLQRNHERIMNELRELLDHDIASADQATDVRASLQASLLAYYTHIYKDVPLYTLWLEARLQASRDPAFRQLFTGCQQSMLDAVAAFAEAFALRAGMKLSLPPAQLALGCMALCDGMAIYHLPGNTQHEDDVERVLAAFMTRIVFRDA